MKYHPFPFFNQHDSMQCGIACLQMICKYYTKTYSTDTLLHYCTATHEGVSLLGISEAAHKLGMNTHCERIPIKHLYNSLLPCILHWNQNHFVVLYKISKEKSFYVADPGKGKIKYSKEEFKSHWVSTTSQGEERGIALFMEPTPGFYQNNIPEKGEKHSFRFLLGYVMQYRNCFLHLFFGLLLGCILQLLMPFLTQGIVDWGIRYKDVKLIWLILLGEFMIVTGRTATDFIRRWLLLHISMRINISLVSDFFIKLMKLPMSFFDTKLMGDLLQRMNDHTRVQSFLTNQVLGIMFTLLSFIVFGLVLFIYNQVIFGVFLLASMIYALWITYFLRRRKILDYMLFEQQAKNQSKTYQFITSMQEIKLQNCEQRRRWEWEDVQAELFTVQMKSLKLQQTQEAGSIFINEVKNILITVLAATAVINGQMTLGVMLAIQYIIGQLNSPIDQLMSFIYSLQDVKISLERINEVHQSPNEEDKNSTRTGYTDKNMAFRISRMSFKYDPHALNNTLTNVSFEIPQGKVTAIVGSSGSGKTTLIKLMLGYYRITEGQIILGGNRLDEYNMKWWRKQCGVVMQDGVIFSESIARNIAVDDGKVDIERLEEAARMANIHDYIMSLPLKYNTLIGRDGIGLSQGQKQRILIARAVYKHPDYIFLDEATNALDANNERIIVENLARFYKGRTVIIVAHRLSTVKNADQIIVLDAGEVVEVGTHNTLIDNKGVYYKLVKNQLELGD